MNTPYRLQPTRLLLFKKKFTCFLFALPLLLPELTKAATPILTAPPGDLQVDVGSTLTFTEGTVTTFVGQDTNGYADGTGTAAQFSTDVQGIDFDVTGNLYISDTSNNRIRKVTSAGVVTTHIGDGTAGAINGTGVAAQINSPKDLIYTNSGTIYFADSGNNRIRQFDAGANVTNFIGKTTAGDAVGKSAQTKFDHPISIAFDETNSYMYVMDKNNFKIKKIDLNLSTNSNSFCTEFVGDGTQGHNDATGTSARISYGGIDIDSSGNLYLADTTNHCIRKITPAGVVTTLVGSAGNSGDAEGSGTTARFNSPVDLTIDGDDFIYVADNGNNKVKRVTPGGVAMDLAGTGTSGVTDGSLFTAEFVAPSSVGFFDEDMYVTQTANGRVRELLRPDHFWVIDTDSATVSVSLAVDNGILTIDLSQGGTITAGSNGSASFTVQGLLDQLNRAFSTLEYDHDMVFTGTDTLTYSATDGVNSTGDSTVDILVQTNTPPTISTIADQNLANHGVDADIDFTVSDIDGDSFTVIYAKHSGDAAVTLTDNGGGNWNILINPDNGFSGTISMSIYAEDVWDAETEEPFFVYVNYTPLAPVLDPIGNQTTDEDVTLNLTLSATDGNGDPLTYSAVVNSGSVTANVSGTSLDLIPDPDWNGTANITVTVDDGNGGTDSETFDLTVNPVSDPPTSANNTVTGNEDEVFVFATFHFPYTDPESDPLDKVRLQAASAGTFWVDTDGSLALDGAEVAVVNNDEVTAANIAKLSFLPDANANGAAYATFLFEVNDGTSYSTSQYTMTIDITAVNDAPTAADNTVTATEDTVFTFAEADFGYTDIDSDPLNKLRLQAATAGTLWVDTDGSGALDGAETAVANNDEVATADITKLKFLADLNDNGVAYSTFLFEVHDGTAYSAAQYTITIDVTAVNDAPTAADNTVTATEDTIFTFAEADFGYTDIDSDPLNKLRLQAATAGTLWVDTDGSGALDGAEAAVANNDEVAVADITKLKFLADLNDNGVAYATFLFEVHDGAAYSVAQYTMTIDVTAVNDAPTAADNTVTATEDTVFTFAEADFGYTDVDSDPLNKLRLQAATAGTLWVDTDGSGALDGAEAAVANNDEVATADITKLKFLADLNDNGVAYSTFLFEVHDGTVYSVAQYTITIDVTAVNDAPTAADNTVTATEDTVFTFAEADFGYSDIESDPLNKLRLQAATAGTLWVDTDGSGALDGAEAAVANNDEVATADITKLKFLADLNDNGVAYSTFLFEVHDGTDYSVAQYTITIDVTAVNDAPTAADNTVNATEDTVFTFAEADFGYSDIESDPLNKLRLQAATAGTLWVDTDGSGALDGAEAAVANNDEVAVADITKLKFLADLNDNGVAYSTFLFEVHDGALYSVAQYTITIDVTAVNDPPTAADNTVTAVEDTVFTFAEADFGYSDIESDPLNKLRLQAATAGTLWVDTDGSGGLDGAEAAVANNDEVAVADITKLKFLADLNDNGVAYSTFLFEVHDGTDYSVAQYTITIDVTAVNDAPTAADNTVTATEDTVFTFAEADFGYTDIESDPLNKLRLQAATAGTLWVDTDGSGALDGAEAAVANNDEVAVADITKLKFLADLNDNGVAYSTFLFEVHDGALYSVAQYTITIDVTAVNDPPTAADNTVTATEDTVFTFAEADFGYTDIESDPLNKLRLQAATAGTLWVDTDGSGALDGAEAAVVNNDEVAAADITKLKFLADLNDNGVAYSTFLFEVHDGALYSVAQYTMTIDVTAVNDAPTAADNTVTATEDTVFTFAEADFGYTDIESDPLNKLRLQAATAGTLWVDTDGSGALDGAEAAVANNDEVAVADITKLKFLADLNDNGVAYSTFLFEVHDGALYSVAQYTMTIDVTAVNDAPTAADNTVTATEDTVFTFAEADFGYTDIESDPLNKLRLQAATAGTLWVDTDGSGALDGAEAAVVNNDEVAAADITKLKFLADLNDNGVAYSTFLFEVHDGALYSVAQYTITIDVTAVNDPPTAADNTVTAIEDTVFTFAEADFGYTDIESDPLNKLRLQAATAGTLWVDTDGSGALDGAEAAVVNNDEVAVADITKLKFLADLNDNGVAYSTFLFEVHDGALYSVAQYTITIDVTAVNDAPTAADNTVTATEDTVFTFAEADFGYTDIESDPLNKLRLQAATAGTLWVDTDGSGALDGAEAAVANNDEVAAADITKLKFLADLNDNGVAYSTFLFEVHDGALYSVAQYTITIDVTAVNDPPTAADNTVTAVEDTVFTFAEADFGYTDIESDPLNKLRLQAATAGTLWVDTDGSGALDGAEAAVVNNDEVAVADITKLKFLADLNDNGVAYSTFLFEVHDGTDYSVAQYTITIDVTAVNDAPTAADNTVTAVEDTVFTFAEADFGYTDIESDPLNKLRLQAATAGTLWVDTDGSGALDGAEAAVVNNDEVAVADITKLKFLADLNDNGVAYSTFLFEVHDGALYSVAQYTITIDVTAVNDPPTAADNTVTAIEDTVFTFAEADFGYTDIESDPLNKLRLQAATAGTLWVDTDGSGALDGAEAAVVNNDEVAAADITKLKFLADLNDNGVAYSTFLFEVHDGTDYSVAQYTITIDVTAVNDPPTAADNTVTAIEDTVFTFAEADFGYTDIESDPLNKLRLQAATAGTLWVDTDGSGALDGAEAAVVNNDEVAVADITKLKFLADLNDNGVAYSTFLFEVHDGALYSVAQYTITIDVTAVNDAPTAADNTVTAIEDTVFTFAEANFGYLDVDSDPLNKLRLQAATAGTLWVDTDGSGALDGAEAAVVNNDEVAVADITKLKFLADLNDNGVAYSTFLFEVHDGTVYSVAQYTMTIDVTAVNDPPTAADNTVTATEDTVFTFAEADFGYSDIESDPLNKLRLQAATAGTLWVDTDGSGALDGAEAAVVNNDEVAVADITKLKFLADLNDNGVAYSTFLFEVHDGTDYSVAQYTITIDVTAVNDAPTAADNTVTATEDTVFTFAEADFGYLDVDSDPLNKLRLQAATAGTLWVDTDGSGALDGAEAAVVNNDEVAVADITKLKFLADLNDNGVAYSTFLFEVHDGTVYSVAQYTMTIDVTAVNDAPTAGDNTVTATEDTVFTFAEADFGYTDIDSDPLNKLRLQAATAGTLWVDTDGSGALDGAEAAVANNDEVAVADITKLKFLADLNDNGVAYSTFLFEVHDGTVYSVAQYTITIDVTAVNDDPTAISLDNDTIVEGEPIGTLVGNFSATDVDTGDTFTYTLVAGAGDTGNASFNIVGDQLQSAAIFNFATQSSYSIRVRVTDSGAGTFEQIFTINIEEIKKTLTINIIPAAGGAAAGDGDYTPGDTAIASVTPAAGYIFSGWTGDVPGGANSTDTPISVLMDADKTLNAYFTPEFHMVDVSVFPERHGYASGGGSVVSGTTITLTATELGAPDTVSFSHWRINGVDDSTNATHNVTVSEDMVVEAVFDMGLPDEYVLIPATSYTRDKNTRNEHTASVSAFYMSSNQTTKVDWYTVYNWAILNGYTFEFDPINANGINLLAHTNPSYLDDYPITGVYWNDMVKWCNARSEMEGFTPSYYEDTGLSTVHRTAVFATEAESLTNNHVDWSNRGYRLPTEAEWEAAARGGYENYKFPNGNTISSQFAYYEQSTDDLAITEATLHARTYNGHRLYDMAGNAWEACWDWWSKDWYQNPLATALDTPGPTLAQTNLDNNYRALRGGSGHSVEKWVAVGARFYTREWMKYPITVRPVFPAPGTPDVTIVVRTEQGQWGTAVGGGDYETSSTATLEAIPTGTATFVEWQDENGTQLSTNATYNHTASADATIYAVFTDTPLPGATLYTLTTYSNPDGTGTITGQGRYVAGTSVDITATANSGYEFVGWYEDLFGTTSPVTITLNQDMVVAAAFGNDVMSFDSDSDGLKDAYETILGTDPFSRDSDNDQIADGLEIDTYGSDPNLVDTDGDGHDDSVEYYFSTNMNNAFSYPFFPKDSLMRHFEMTGGLAVDSSPNSANGVASNTTAATDRHSTASEAATFNGVNASITASGYNGVTGSGARTLSGWVRVDPANSGPIIAYGSGANTFEVNIAAGGTLEVIADAATLTGTTNLTDSAWHHFVVMFPEGGSPSNISIRIDGSFESYSSAGDTASTLATASSSAVLIGTNSVGQFFTGDIDEIRLYERRMLAWEAVELNTLEASPQPAEVPVSISTQPATTVVAFGDSTSLSVTATATPAPIYQWEAQYEGTWHFIDGETSSTLNFASATDYDGRAYRVSIIDTHGNVTITNQARLYVLHPPTLANPEPDVSFVVNVGGKIAASVAGSAKMYYEWFKDSVSLGAPSTASGIIIPNTATQATHGGSYHYIATNSVGTLTSNTFTVSIIDPVTITVQPVPTGIIAGDNGSISITATGGGTLQYQWYEYDKTTGTRTAVDGETSDTLNFTSMDASQEGIYGCEVTNGPSTRWSKFVLVTMYVAPVFTTQPTDLTVNEFDFVQIDSLATGVPNPTYQWEKYNTTTTLWEDVTNFVYPFLRYKTVRAEMAGTYRVVATNAAGTATSDQAVLTVYYKPVITSDIYNVTANEDTDVTFTVDAHGLDAGGATITYQWYFNGVAMTDGAEVTGSATNALTLTTVNKADNYGKYYCTLTNAMGTVQSRTAVMYIVEKPYALTTLVDQTIDEGQKLYLWVYVKGTLPLTMQWYKDAVPIPGAIYTKFTISAVTPGDAGLYSFVASNAAGSFQQDANITVTSASTASSAGAMVMKKDTSDPYGDADGDGLGNLLEEALGSNPSNPNSTFYPDIEIMDGGDGNKYASIQYSISKTTEGISVILEQSTDLKNWQPVNLGKATISSLERPTYTATTVYLPIESTNLFFRVQANK